MALTAASGLFVLFSLAVKAQDPFAPDSVVAEGNPPLTESMVTRFTNFQSWLFEIPFTPQQREKIRNILVKDWSDPKEIKNDLQWLSMAATIGTANLETREFIRIDLQEMVLKDLRADKNNPDSQWWVANYDQARRPIAPGNPPLTESMVSHYITFTAWLLEIPLTQPLKDRMRALLLEDWTDPRRVENDVAVLKFQREMAGLKNGELERQYKRTAVQGNVLNAMRADKGSPEAQLLVPAYEAAHPLIAAGNPPLTRQASDAWVELFCFVHNQSSGPKAEVTDALKDAFARELAANWAGYSPQDRTFYAQMPRELAAVRLVWATGTDADRQKILAKWQPIVNPGQSGHQQLAAAQEAVNRVSAFLKRDPNTVSDQELLATAKDAEAAGLFSRREGTPQGVGNAAIWEEWARVMRSGKAAYVQRYADDRAKAAIVEEWQKTRIIENSINRIRAIPR